VSQPVATIDKFSVARSLREIATLLVLSGDVSFKARAYRKAAAALESLQDDLGRVIEEYRLEQIPGIGPKLAGQIAELWRTGRSSTLERLASALPPGCLELADVPGLTIARIRALHEALGPVSLAELARACERQLVRRIPGFGPKTEARILEGIRTHQTRQVRVLMTEAARWVEIVAAYLRASNAFLRIEPAGELRRGLETIGELVLVASVTDERAAREHFAKLPCFASVAPDGGSGRLASGLEVRLVTAPPERFEAALFVQTGPEEHVRVLAPAPLDESEARIYADASLPPIPPELRDAPGIVEAARAGERFDDLVTERDIAGIVHCHTEWSDGRHTIEQMALAAERAGASYITITDHSQSAHYAGGLGLEQLEQQWEEIARVQERVNIRLLRGIESDILADGALDYPDAVLDRFDVIIASIHSRMRMDEAQMTQRLLRAMRLPRFKIWGHALGRLLLRRPPFACRVEEILDAVAESPAAIEVNGDPHRLDLEPRWIRAARRRKIPFVISTDAHSTGNLSYLRWGVRMARRGGLRRGEVLNTLGAHEFAERVRPH
jgi:DNA polymerase (family X)